jgi:hypothetical protein
MDFTKVQRVNFAFFQTDTEGNLFGTDSWADPNSLFVSFEVELSQLFLCQRVCNSIFRLTLSSLTPNSFKKGPYDWNPSEGAKKYCSWDSVVGGEVQKACNFHYHEQGLIHLVHAAGAEVSLVLHSLNFNCFIYLLSMVPHHIPN